VFYHRDTEGTEELLCNLRASGVKFQVIKSSFLKTFQIGFYSISFLGEVHLKDRVEILSTRYPLHPPTDVKLLL
jgi:hypothetical protein